MDNKKKGVAVDYLIWWIIAAAVLVIVLINIFLLKGKGISLIDKIKDIFRGW